MILGAWRDDAQAEMWGWLYQGTSLLRQGDLQEAIARFRNGERLLHAGVGGANVGWLYGLMAETYWRLDDNDRARASAASAGESLYTERPGVVFALDGFTGAAEAMLRVVGRRTVPKLRGEQVRSRTQREEVDRIQQGVPDRASRRPSLLRSSQGADR